MLTKTKVAINAFKAARKRSGDGIESQTFGWMKVLFRVQQPAYHGGKLIGGDYKLMMAHAHQMFTHFATILKNNKKDSCEYTDPQIDELCANFCLVSVLWDGAFSMASKVNPTANDIQLFRQYVRAAIWSHQALNILITHKVHLMWWHVAIAMELPGGLGKKREDWLEKQHQEGSLLRK